MWISLIINKIIIMQQSNQQVSDIKEILHNPINVRYRKISMSGTAVQAFIQHSPDKVKPKQIMLEFPRMSDHLEEQVSLKVVQQDYYKKYKAESGIKSLLRAYDETRKKNSQQCMTKLGLDVIKVKSFSSHSANKTGISFKPIKIHSKNSLKNYDMKHVYNREMLCPIKNKTAREPKISKEDQQIQLEFRHIVQLTSSMTNITIDKQKRGFQSQSPKKQGKRVFKKQRKAEQYLYKRLQGTQKQLKEEQNLVYDKRIKSYLEFLWKNMYAHNIYINLDIKHDQITSRPRKLKAYIALGNNGAMVRGLLKRRFWWTLTDEKTADCSFIWTQIKVNEIFARQMRSQMRKPMLKDDVDWQQQQVMNKKNNSISKLRLSKFKYPASEQNNNKLMSVQDEKLYKRYWNKLERDKQRQFSYKNQNNPKQLELLSVDHSGVIIHNHLQYNFYLGNKKALFYNLRQYYGLINQNLFDHVPLTFHIRKGTKDPEYIRFLDYYKKRAKQIEKEVKEQQLQGIEGKTKTRNIWIVKPGENSNQGRGITVIDQIYELNSLIKQEKQSSSTIQGVSVQQTQRTYIVQMYIDRPLLYNNRKFDIRHYMLISNFFGITRAYWYDQGYVRTSSYQFDIHNFAPEIHLTNDAVQKRFSQYGRYEPSNKISYDQFQRYLDSNYGSKKYNFKQQILPQMKKMGTDAAKSVYTKISPKNQMNNFQIFGLDFMIDKNFKPWLIQINTNPCLECVCPLLSRIIPYMVEQSFKLTLDLAFPPPTHYPNTSKHMAPLVLLEKFKYELIFDSQYQGEHLTKLYKRIRSNIIQKIGEIQQDEQFKDEGKQCKLDDYT